LFPFLPLESIHYVQETSNSKFSATSNTTHAAYKITGTYATNLSVGYVAYILYHKLQQLSIGTHIKWQNLTRVLLHQDLQSSDAAGLKKGREFSL